MPEYSVEKRLDIVEQQLRQASNLQPSVFSKNEHTEAQMYGSRNRDEIDILELWGVIWSAKWAVLSITIIFALASVFYVLSLPNIYRSEALLAPAEQNAGGGIAGLGTQLGGLASLAGVSIGGGSDKTLLAIEVLKSRAFVSKFIQKHGVLLPLMAGVDWDSGQDKLIIDPDVYDTVSQQWLLKSENGNRLAPSMQQAYRKFIRIMNVSQDKTSGFVSLNIEFYSPSFAKKWVDLLVEEINLEIKNREVLEAQRSIEYLSVQLAKTPVAEMQRIFYEMIEEQSKVVMLAEVREEYVFKTLDGAVVPEKKVKPRKAVICMLAAIFGGVFSVCLVLVRYFLRKAN